MSTTLVDDVELAALLSAWLPEQRWYAEKGSALLSVEVVSRTTLADTPLDAPGGLALEHVLLRVRSGSGADGAEERTAVYQVPVSHVRSLPEALAGTVIGAPEGEHAIPCDALRDPRAHALVARLLAEQATVGPVRFSAGTGAPDPDGRSRTLAVEQSNTTVVYDDAVLVKWFRRVPDGINPDVEVLEALSGVGCPAIAELRGHVDVDARATGSTEAGDVTLAMVQEFLPGSADGWSMATASVRDLLAEADLLAEDVGTDFADEAHRLGQAVARVHADLRTALGAETVPGERVAEALRRRLDDALAADPELEAAAGKARELVDEVAALGEVEVQRVHGDLHLGQALRALDRWVLIDFEGEPAAPLAERRRPDSPLRDVAGMLRSLDYAAGHALVGEQPDRQRRFRAREWTERNCSAFCDGYAEATGADPRAQSVLLRAYELDKALYEVGYEARNRPAWLPIPRAAVERLVGA